MPKPFNHKQRSIVNGQPVVGDIVQCVRCGAVAAQGEKLEHMFPCVDDLGVFYNQVEPEDEDEGEDDE
jgi:hypothetical protein